MLPTLVPGMHTCVCVQYMPRMHSYSLMISLCLFIQESSTTPPNLHSQRYSRRKFTGRVMHHETGSSGGSWANVIVIVVS